MTLLSCVASLWCLTAFSDNKVRCDFSQGIPSSFTLIDADGNEPSPDIMGYGFKVGTPWVAIYQEKEGNHVAASTSWYAKSGTSSDWMILPALHVESENSVLAWRGKASNKRFPDGYAIYVTDKGGTSVTDFDTSRPLFATGGEAAEWTRHSVSLAEYVGKNVRIAFVNNSTDCSMLYIDDIFAGEPDTVAISLAMPHIVRTSDEICIEGTVETDLEQGIKGFTLSWTNGEHSGVRTFSDAEAKPGHPYAFSIATGQKIDDGQRATYHLTVNHDDQEATAEKTVTAKPQHIVGEELTGTWCSWCVRGIVMMDSMSRAHGDGFIGIAVHGRDFLSITEYTDYINRLLGTPGYPACTVNRMADLGSNVDDVPAMYKALRAMPLGGSIDLAMEKTAGGDYEATTKVTVNNGGKYKLGFCIVEDDVYEEGDNRYWQGNAYAGGANGKMGGYENLPDIIDDFHFQHVARQYTESAGSLPDSLTAGTEYAATTEIALPSTILNKANVAVVAMLINASNGQIVNAARATLPDAEAGIADAKSPKESEVIATYTLSGRRVTEGEAPKGICIMLYKNGERHVKVCQ